MLLSREVVSLSFVYVYDRTTEDLSSLSKVYESLN